MNIKYGHLIIKKVKKIMIMLVFIYSALLFMPTLCESDQKDVFIKANELYRKSEWAEAATLFQSIHNPGPAVWHNLGNCYWYLEKYKDAFIAYKKAWKDSSSDDKKHLKDLMNQSKKKWLGSESKDSVETWDNYLTMAVKPIVWQCIFLLIWIILLLSFKAWSRGMFFKITFIVLICITFFCGYSLKFFITDYDSKAIIVHHAELLIIPKKGVASLKTLSAGDEVVIIDSYQDWAKVKAQNDVGWIMQSDCEAI